MTVAFITARLSHVASAQRDHQARIMRTFALCLMMLSAVSCGGAESTDPAASSIGQIALSQASLTLGVGSSVALEVSIVDLEGNSITPRNVFWSSSDASVARVSVAGVVTAVAPGTAQIAATVQGKSAVANLTVAPTAVASVQLSQSDARLTIGDRVQVTARTLDANGGTLTGRVVVWKSNDPSVAAVDSTGRITALTPGGTTITATSEGRVASVAVFVSAVPAASIALTPGSASIVEGQTTQLNAEARSASGAVLTGRTIAWTSANASIASVSSAGLVTGVSPGSTIITASSEGRSATATITVSARPVSGIVVSPSQLSMIVGQAVRLSAQVTDANGNLLAGRAVGFRSENTAVATVAADGTVTGVSTGSTSITVTSEGRTASVPVVVAPVPVASIRVTPDAAAINVGQQTTLSAAAIDAAGRVLTGRTISWSSGSPSVATVSHEGVVTAVGVGTVVVFAQAEGQTSVATITVRAAPIASVTLSPSANALTVGGTAALSASVLDANGAQVIGRAVFFESSNVQVATVSTSGRVTALGPGIATITGSVDGKSGTASVTVAAVPVNTVAVTPQSASVTVGGTTDLSATVRDANGAIVTGKMVTWQSSSSGTATVSSTGRVTGVAPGTASITATVDGKVGTAVITVNAVPVASVSVSPSSRTLEVGATVALTATVTDANGAAVTGRTVMWTSSNSSVAAVNSSGTVTAIAPGNATITASVDGRSGTAAITVSTPQTLGIGRIEVTPNGVDLKSTGPTNRAVQLTATAYNSATGGSVVNNVVFVWTSSAPLVASVSQNGVVTALSDGTTVIAATSGGRVGTSIITVNKK